MFKFIVLTVVVAVVIDMNTVDRSTPIVMETTTNMNPSQSTENNTTPGEMTTEAQTTTACPDGLIQANASVLGLDIPIAVNVTNIAGDIVSVCINGSVLSNGQLLDLLGSGSILNLVSGNGALGGLGGNDGGNDGNNGGLLDGLLNRR